MLIAFLGWAKLAGKTWQATKYPLDAGSEFKVEGL